MNAPLEAGLQPYVLSDTHGGIATLTLNRGERFNPHKLLIDPYAKALAGPLNWDAPVFGYNIGDPAQDVSFSADDDAWGVPKSVVTTDHTYGRPTPSCVHV